MFAYFEKILTKAEETVIFLCIISSLIVIFVNIVLRYVFTSGFVFSEEYARYTMVLLVYLGVSQAIKNGSMIKVDILTSFFPKAEFTLNVISNIAALISAVLLIWFGIKFTLWQATTGQKSIAMQIPMYIAYSIVPMGGALMLLRYIVSTLELFRPKKEE
jgi:C4-dicarboxylate transporter DctQ subunit